VSLRLQLLTFGSLILVLPWAGMRFVQEMEAALRAGLEASLLASAQTVADVLGREPALAAVAELPGATVQSGTTPIYAQPLAAAPRVDGFDGDWTQAAEALGRLPGGGHEYRAGTYQRYAYLFLAVRDEDRVYQASPGQQPYGDRIVLRMREVDGTARWLLLSTAAPGNFRPQLTRPGLFAPTGSFEDRVLGAWRETSTGYSVELRIPIQLLGGVLGMAVVDVDTGVSAYTVNTNSSWPLEEIPGRFLYQRQDLQVVLDRFARAGDRFRVLDSEGWVLSETGNVASAGILAPSSEGGFAERLFRFVLRRDDPDYETLEQPVGHIGNAGLRAALAGDPATAWFRRGPEGNAIVAAAVPVRGAQSIAGAVLIEQASDSILTLTDRALLRLMSFTILAIVVAAAGLLGFATLLSFRVRRLAHAAENALGPKGEIDTRLPGGGARDEIGDLSRSFADLLRRLREHTQYLRTLTSKLSHELRTPLAIMSTSLDNLEQERDPDAAQVYLQRLRSGSQRLDGIVVAMSEATRIELAIGETDKERFDLHVLLAACCTAYQDVYDERRIVYRGLPDGGTLYGSKDLLAQLLDKLVDNAVSFSPAFSDIVIELSARGEQLQLAVSNNGPVLPATMREQLFESLVSFRAAGDERPHLGLGLYIVALIAQFHDARVAADNLPSGDGVVFTVRFPRPD
jgi:dedicated sortase system histidine kinase